MGFHKNGIHWPTQGLSAFQKFIALIWLGLGNLKERDHSEELAEDMLVLK